MRDDGEPISRGLLDHELAALPAVPLRGLGGVEIDANLYDPAAPGPIEPGVATLLETARSLGMAEGWLEVPRGGWAPLPESARIREGPVLSRTGGPGQ